MLIKQNKTTENISASCISRIKTGGNIELFVEVSDLFFLVKTIRELKKKDKKFVIIGAGSNIIFSDETFEGAVIRLGGDFNDVVIKQNKVVCGAGAFLPKVGYSLAKKGYSGFEFMCVIPGTIGGGVKSNAGTRIDGTISDNFISANILNIKNDIIQNYNHVQMNFGNRFSSLLHSSNIILSASFDLNKSKKTNVEYLMKKINKIKLNRSKKQPQVINTFGSTFKNNNNYSAGWYLEQVGMKGMRYGGAMVSTSHANWIVNLGNAKSNDVKKLILIGAKRVKDTFGVSLEREVIYLPEDME